MGIVVRSMISLVLAFFFALSLTQRTPEEIVAQMTLEEKAGQVTQAERKSITNDEIRDYFIGSVLSGGGSVPTPNTPQGWVDLLNGYANATLQTRLAIPVIYGLDAVHGHSNLLNATIFPHNVGYGATAVGNLTLGVSNVEEEGLILLKELRATGHHWTFAPVLGNPQDIHWGRTYEGYSENISIPTALGAAFIKGVQSEGNAIGTLKHYMGEGQAANGVNRGNAVLSETQIRALLQPYKAAIDAGALAVMPSFNSINGTKCSINKFILTTLLKEELGFKGFLISDWGAVEETPGSYKQQVANSINAGMDMIMAAEVKDWKDNYYAVIEAVNDGLLPIERLNDACVRIIRVKQRLGLFDNPYEKAGEIGIPASLAVARRHVAETLVLLKNKNTILSRLSDFNNILVAGQGGNDIGMQSGGWTITWQGSHGPITAGTTIYEGIANALPGKNVTYSEKGDISGTFDVAFVVVGEDPYAEGDGDRSGDIYFRPEDSASLENVYKLGIPVIVITLTGRPLHIGKEVDKWDAFISAWLPGPEAGLGIADVLFGDKDFVAKTPYTWRATYNGPVLYPYGAGLTKRQE